MVRGSIENVANHHISGWMYCSATPLRDRVVLAYLDDRCIGSGKIGLFREDLKKAGLGDGVCGFRFPIMHVAEAEQDAIVVKVEGCDSVLIQKRARVVSLRMAVAAE